MRVLIISHNYPHPARPEDAEFVARQVDSLAALGVSLHVVSPVPYAPRVPACGTRLKGALAASRTKPLRWLRNGITIDYPRYVKLPGRLDLGMFGPLCYRGIRACVRRLHAEQPFDVLHGQWLVPDGYAAARLARELGIASVSSERGYAARYPDRGPRFTAIHRTVEAVDQIVTVSEALARRVAALGTPQRPVRVVYTGVDAEQFSECDAAAARRELRLPAGRYLVCCARCETIKLPLLAWEAFCQARREVPELHLAWVGDGTQREVLRTAAADAGLANFVHLPGGVPHADVPRWLAAADVVLLASRSEGLPNSLVEAAACARPIVATRVGGIPEVVSDGETGLLVDLSNDAARDAAGMSAAIVRLLKNPIEARTMGARGRERALDRFSWQRHAADMLDVYHSVTTHPQQPQQVQP